MSSATLVPETRTLTGDDAWETLRRTGRRKLAKDAFKRLRVADGFSHARSLAFMISLVAIEGLIGLVGLASVLHKGAVSAIIDSSVRRTIPGPAGHVLTTAVTQAHHVAAHVSKEPKIEGAAANPSGRDTWNLSRRLAGAMFAHSDFRAEVYSRYERVNSRRRQRD